MDFLTVHQPIHAAGLVLVCQMASKLLFSRLQDKISCDLRMMDLKNRNHGCPQLLKHTDPGLKSTQNNFLSVYFFFPSLLYFLPNQGKELIARLREEVPKEAERSKTTTID